MNRSGESPGCKWAALTMYLFVGTTAIAAQPSEGPGSPQKELATFQFADENLTAELVVSEPEVVAPVAIAWDADGRLFVAEMTDYPSGPVSGRIRMLEDRDGDGRYEHSTAFADKIAFPNGVMPWNGGVLVTAAPDILFFKDTDSDGRADERRVLLTGFVEGNQQLRVNGLYWGLDNWIYGANGRSDGEVQWGAQAIQPARSGDVPAARSRAEGKSSSGRSNSPTTQTAEPGGSVNRQAGKPALQDTVSIRRRDFRFRPETRQFEAIAGHSQFGCAHDDWGNRFPVFNNIPIRYVVIEQRYLDRQPLLAGIETVVPISAPDDKGRVYYLAPPTLLIPQASDYFTSACGPTVYRGDALGAGYRGNFFVCEPVHNLIQRRRLTPSGASFIADRTEIGRDFLASTDPWFHPVFTSTGPDGALYIVDFYRKYVEHPHWVADELKTTVPWRTGEEHGRIWRIRPKNWKPKSAKPNLSHAKSRDLVKHLEHENGWWRDTAQRLLVERQDRTVAVALERMARQSPSPLARLHALYTLDGLNALSPDTQLAALKDSLPVIREHAIRLAEQFLSGGAIQTHRESPVSDRSHQGDEVDQSRLVTSAHKSGLAGVSRRQSSALTNALFALVDDPSPHVRFQLGLTIGGIEGEQKLLALSRLAQTGAVDRWQSLAILTSIGPRPWLLWKALQNSKSISGQDEERAWFADKLAALVANGADENDVRESAADLEQDTLPFFVRMVLLSNLVEAQKANPFIRQLLSSQDIGQIAGRIVAEAERVALSPEGPLPIRLVAIRLLGRRPSPGIHSLTRLLLPENPPEAQSATITALGDANEPVAAGFALDKWERYTISTRHQLIAAALRSTALAKALFTALEQGKILLIEVDPATRQALQKTQNADLQRRAEQLFKGAVSANREQVVQSFKPALQMIGDRKHGAEIFAKTCVQCHAMQGEGNRVGPDLSGIAAQPKETMLMNILDPSRQVSPDFLSYTVVPADGETLIGLMAAESASSITLRRPNAPDVTIQRSQIKELKADGKSLMPDGLEQGLTVQDMADLLGFLRQPDSALLPK